jgi:hypothetical protein
MSQWDRLHAVATATTPHLFGLYGAEELNDTVEEVAERAAEDGYESPIEIEEWTSKPLRAFIHASNAIDHVIEWDTEDYCDDHGQVRERLEKRAVDPEVVAAFDAALDLLFKDVGWRWADQLVARWTVTWDADMDPPEFRYERAEVTK